MEIRDYLLDLDEETFENFIKDEEIESYRKKLEDCEIHLKAAGVKSPTVKSEKRSLKFPILFDFD